METPEIELQRRVKGYLEKNPGKERELAHKFGCSIPTVERIAKGINSPHTSMCHVAIQIMKELDPSS